MRLFRILFAFDAIGLLVLAYFFVEGLQYGAGGDYMGTWAPILLLPMVGLAGAWGLRANGRAGAANALLAVLAAPFVLYLLFIGLFVVLEPDMR
ncbi:MAG TPA: hypothetical protein VI168_02610 [Croceibacterium sp.]